MAELPLARFGRGDGGAEHATEDLMAEADTREVHLGVVEPEFCIPSSSAQGQSKGPE